MATFQIEIPDETVELVANSFASQFHMPKTVDQVGDEQETLLEDKIEFARQQTIMFIQNVVKQHQYLEVKKSEAPTLNIT